MRRLPPVTRKCPPLPAGGQQALALPTDVARGRRPRPGLARAVTELMAPANLAVAFGPALTLTVPTVALVAWSRVRLGDHTPAQTLAGAALGGLVAPTVFI